MRILVLGGSGHIGGRLLEQLECQPWAEAVSASRHAMAGTGSRSRIRLDSRDVTALTAALQGVDAVVNCVAGDANSIEEGARALVQAARAAGGTRLVHLSTQSVYGPVESVVREDAPLDPRLGWYGRAKCQAEQHIADYARQGGAAVVLRPGCVFGPGSQLWVGRLGRWLRAGRLGDLGVAGDGWSNLVHVDDVCQALIAALRYPAGQGQLPTFNLAAPDSPRWNGYFVDLALALHATPVRRIGPRQLWMDLHLMSPPLKAAQLALHRLGRGSRPLADALPPGLARLWSQHLRLDASLATQQLRILWTPYATAVQQSAAWLGGGHAMATTESGGVVCSL